MCRFYRRRSGCRDGLWLCHFCTSSICMTEVGHSSYSFTILQTCNQGAACKYCLLADYSHSSTGFTFAALSWLFSIGKSATRSCLHLPGAGTKLHWCCCVGILGTWTTASFLNFNHLIVTGCHNIVTGKTVNRQLWILRDVAFEQCVSWIILDYLGHLTWGTSRPSQ